MRTIYKYKLEVKSEQIICTPRGARILSLQVQDSTPCLWVEVDPNAEGVDRDIYMYGTGHPIAVEHRGATFLGTVQIDGFVWHYFMVT